MKKSLGSNLLRPIFLAAILGCGATIVWAIAIGWTAAVIEQMLSQRQPGETLVFTTDGDALVRSYRSDSYQEMTYRTPQGQSIEPFGVEVQNDGALLPRPNEKSVNQLGWYMRVVGFAQIRGVPTYWYLMHDGQPHGHAYFALFDAKSRGKTGYFGFRGFRPDVPPVEEQFEIESRLLSHGSCFSSESFSWGRAPSANSETVPVVFVVSNDSLLRVDLQRQLIRPIPLPGRVLSVSNLSEPIAVEDERGVIYKRRIAVRLPEQIIWLSLEGETLRSTALPLEVRDRELSVFGTTGSDSILVTNPIRYGALPNGIYWVDQQGHVARHEEVRLYHGAQGDDRVRIWAFTGLVPSPMILTLAVFTFFTWNDMGQDDTLDYRAALVQSLEDAWPPLVAVCLLSAILAVLCYWHHRRYSKTGALAWAAFVLLLGVPGLIGYWLRRRWPVTERCAQCGALVPRDRESCLACAVEFPAPELKGIEVFA